MTHFQDLCTSIRWIDLEKIIQNQILRLGLLPSQRHPKQENQPSHLSLRVTPLDLQQGGNSRILYVHVPAARMSILVYIATAINTFLFLLTKHPLFLRSSGTGTEMGAFFTLFTLVTGGFRGIPMWGTFWVWDARLTSVFISFLIYLGALRFQNLPVEPASISIRVGPIDIPIIKFSVNWWNTSHQPGSISRSGTSIHVPNFLVPE
ncbi:putative cytochrome c biosynthesis ccmC-like mitochondrial protein [Benincasa hispida]|uniref:putative cytochrome c biosynthesis ccmC-like mitochondrial protein n=1 Tax=Benincasa hispida TaxID=102211 RepID=UPI0018FF6AB5|nr:putative cytochrome c biosynthesis ccmC-like mitochondrial protein [Benincasa hispida]